MPLKTQRITYLLVRLPVAMSMFGHGLERMPKLSGFTQHMTDQFKNAVLPLAAVEVFSHVLPFIELLLGILLIIGLFTRFAAVVGVLVMLALIFGSSMIEQWENVFTQIVYGLCFAAIYHFEPYNFYSADRLLRLGNSL
jgi:thiosulfate dehydrogenase [quinone] large subunit